VNRQTIAHLEQIIEDQAAEIEQLVARLAAYEQRKPKKRVTPAIR
jgi:nitrogen-specific signal transduction histidine kinase